MLHLKLTSLCVAALALAGCNKIIAVVTAATWDGQSQLVCGGSQSMTIKDKNISLARVTSAHESRMIDTALFDVGGNCELTIENSNIEAPLVLSAGGNARVHFIGGSITSPQAVIHAGGNAEIRLTGTKLKGRIERGGHAAIRGLPELDAVQAQQDLSRKYGATACDDLRPCLKQTNYSGNLAVRLSGKLAPSGNIAEVELWGLPTPAIANCVRERMLHRALSDYDGKPGGQLLCTASGSVAGENEMLMIEAKFIR